MRVFDQLLSRQKEKKAGYLVLIDPDKTPIKCNGAEVGAQTIFFLEAICVEFEIITDTKAATPWIRTT